MTKRRKLIKLSTQVHPRTGKRKAKISIKFWSVYKALMEGNIYVNNHLEGFNSAWNAEWVPNESIWATIDRLRSEEQLQMQRWREAMKEVF